MVADMLSATLPTFADVEAAAGRLAGQAVVTPLLESPLLNDRLGGRLLVKAEVLQRTGSFKFRGAFNRISLIPEAERARGVVAFSSGNHAQGVAAAARLLGIPATIVMPSDAPAIKVGNTRDWGARVVLYDRWKEDREAIGARISAETGATLVRPYDDPYIMAGQGTIGLELADQSKAAGAQLDAVLAPCGGGGMISGIALAIAARSPGNQGLCRRTRRLRRYGAVAGGWGAAEQRRRGLILLRCPSGAHAGRADFRRQLDPSGRRFRGDRCRSGNGHGGCPRSLQAGGGAGRRRGACGGSGR